MLKKISLPSRIWLGLFALWMVFLSGALNQWIGSPGLVQAYALRSLLKERQAREAGLRSEIAHLQSEQASLEKNKVAQVREIRRVLGYVAPREMIFEFAPGVSE